MQHRESKERLFEAVESVIDCVVLYIVTRPRLCIIFRVFISFFSVTLLFLKIINMKQNVFCVKKEMI